MQPMLGETRQPASSLMEESGLSKASTAESLETSRAGDVSELETVEMSQPILESTSMAMSSRQDSRPSVSSFEETDDEHFRNELRYLIVPEDHLLEAAAGMSNSSETPLNIGDTRQVIITASSGPWEFYLQLKSQGDALRDMEHSIEESIDANEVINPVVGDICAAKLPDCTTQRVKILKIHKDLAYEVQCIDTGIVEKHVLQSCLKSLPESILKIPPAAIHCYLTEDVPYDEEDPENWNEIAIDLFQGLVDDLDEPMIHVLYHDVLEKEYGVELYNGPGLYDGHEPYDGVEHDASMLTVNEILHSHRAEMKQQW